MFVEHGWDYLKKIGIAMCLHYKRQLTVKDTLTAGKERLTRLFCIHLLNTQSFMQSTLP